MKSVPTQPPRALQELEAAMVLVVPDLLRVTFSASIDSASGRQGLAALERAGATLSSAVRGTLPAATVDFLEFRLRQVSKLKSRGDDTLQPTVTGQIDLPLAPELSFWGRARLVTALCTITESASAEALRAKPRILVSFGHPTALVAQPGSHRSALIGQWLERINSFSAQASKSGICSALRLKSCSLPGAVSQHPRSLLEVALKLEISPLGPLEVFHGPTADS